MRKILFLCLLFIGLLSTSAQTQESFPSKVTVRPTIGLNIGSESSGDTTSNSIVSFKGGAIADYAFTQNWDFRSVLLTTVFS